MEIKHNTKNLLHLPLPDLLEKFYSAAVLKQFAEMYLHPLFPELRSMEKPRKADLISALMSLKRDRIKLRKLVDSFSPELFKTLERLLWTDWVSLEKLESDLGFEITRPHPNFPKLMYRECAYELLLGFELIALGEIDDFSSWYSREPTKSRLRLRLPSAVRQLLKPGFPKPRHYDWEAVELDNELTAAGASRFSAEATIAAELALIGDYLQRGNLKLTKSGKITAASLRSIMELTSGAEFFPGTTASRKLPALRHTLLIQAVLKFEDKLVKLLGKESFPADSVFDQLITGLLGNTDLLLEMVLPHIKPAFTYSGSSFPAALDSLRQVFASLPEGEWVTAGNLLNYPVYRELDLMVLNPYHHRFRANEDSPGRRQGRHYGSTVDLRDDNIRDIVQAPLLYGSSFLLAAFGLLEIAYTDPPEHPRWRVPGEAFLSPFDGLVALRLTAPGAFAFGQTRDLHVSIPEKRAAQVHLHPQRLIASCQSADPLTLAAMHEFMERLAPGLYRLTPEKFLAGCHSRDELRDRVASFRQRIPADVPDLWEATFRGWIESPDPLSCENAYFVYQIADSDQLRGLFTRDPVLRKLGLKVEGWRIAVTPEDLKRIRDRLCSLGFLLESGAAPGANTGAGKKVPRKKARRRRW